MKENNSFLSLGHPRYWLSWVGLVVMRLISLLPLPLLWISGSALGGLLYFLHAPRRHIVIRNIESCFPHLDHRAQRRMARRHFYSLGQASLSSGIAWWGSKSRLERLVRCRDRHYYDQALALGRPVILLAAHFVAMEIGGLYLSRERPMVDMYRRVKNKLFDEVFKRGRVRFGGRVVERREGLKPIIKLLREGVVFIYLLDQDPGRHNTAFVPFLGVPAATLTALGRLTRITNAIVVPSFTRQLPRGQGYEVIFKPALDNFPTGDDVADAVRMNQEIEKGVLDMPEQYFWVHKRFKTRPEGEPDFYR
jgi:Kdo2-lipid IVA lauroyltransferase/acyltransferase